MGRLLLLFILVPLVDAWLLFQLGGILGFASTLALVMLTGIAGAWLFRLEGTRTWSVWQASLSEGRVPEEGVLGGVMLLLGGALLVTPGVITDAVGLLLLLPPTRRLLAAALRPRLQQFVKDKAQTVVGQAVRGGGVGSQGVSTRVRVVQFGFGGGRRPEPRRTGETEIVGRRITAGAAGERGQDRRRQVIDADFEIKPE